MGKIGIMLTEQVFSCGCPRKISQDDIYELDFTCPKIWRLISSGRTTGIFQLESNFGQSWIKKIKAESIEELADVTALLRPGATQSEDSATGKTMTQLYCDRKHGREPCASFHESLDEILLPSQNVLVFQEQAMRIAMKVAGFSETEADDLRKCVTGDTKFLSRQRGWISIDKLLETHYNDEFLIMDELGNQKWKRIDKIWGTGKHDINIVKNSQGMSVKATRYHQFLTDTGWKARSRLSEEDYLLSPSVADFDGEDKISLDMAIVIGGMLTEGYFIKEASTFTNHESDIMKTFASAFYNLYSYKNIYSDNVTFGIRKSERNKINKYLKYGLSKDKEIPDVCLSLTKETMRHMLGFMFACELGVMKDGNIEYTSASPIIIEQLQLILLRYGITSYISTKRNKKYDRDYYYLGICDQEQQQRFLDEFEGYYIQDYKIHKIKKAIRKKKSQYTLDVFPSSITTKMIDQYPYIGKGESGTLYTSPISRKRFSKCAVKTQDSYWIDLSKSNHRYSRIKDMYTKKRQVYTYDFSMSDDSCPYIIANGIVIHNSMGKKDSELMEKVEGQFLKGSKKVGLMSQPEAEEVFNWIKASQRYAFNSSHALLYSIVAYWSAYMKVHYPLHFYHQWLLMAHEKIDKYEEVRNLILDGRSFGINFLPPDITSSKEEFSIEGDSVRVGLSNVKDVGLSQARKLVEMDWSPYYNKWVTLLLEVLVKLNSKVSVALIEVGAFDVLTGMGRQKMLYELKKARDLTSKELEKAIEIQREKQFEKLQDLIMHISRPKKEGGAAHNFRRTEKLESLAQILENPPYNLDDTVEWKVKREENRIGISVSCKITDIYEKHLTDASCSDIINGRSGRVSVLGTILEANKITTKKGSKMAFMRFSDGTAMLSDVIVFSNQFEKYASHIKKNNVVIISGDADDSVLKCQSVLSASKI